MIELHANSPVLRDPKVFAWYVRRTLGGIVWLNEQTFKAYPRFPLLYRSGVRYEREPEGIETFVDASECLKAGNGDCAHLAAWRCAELRTRFKVKATVAIKFKVFPELGMRVFHVVVRVPLHTPSKLIVKPYLFKGRLLEDPSKILGMR